MRTTIDLPEDLHQIAVSIARDRAQTLSQTVADLLRKGLGQGQAGAATWSDRCGFPVVHLGVPVTSDTVKALDDEE